jgi:C-terminal processing protease CtpA/Prc
MSFPPLPYRILALFRYWSIIHYFFPYRELCDTRWADVLALMLPDFVFAEDRKQYALACLKLASLIDDSHGFVQIADSTTHYDIYGRRKVPFETQFIEEQLVVTSFTSQNSEVRKEVSIGDIITTINGEKVETVVARMYPYTPASNNASKYRDIAKSILQTNDSVLTIGFLRDGKTATMTIPTYSLHQLTIPDMFNPKPKQEGYSIFPDFIGYIYPSGCKFEERKTKLPQLMKSTKGLIIDLRCYPSDYMAQDVASYLMKYPGYYSHKTHGSVSMPGYTFFYQHHPSPTNLDIGSYPYKVVVLVNEVTQSQAEDHTFFYYLAPRVTIIGSTTAGADGRVTRFAMPGNIMCYFTGWGVYYPDGTCLQRAGVKLDEEVRPTIAGIKEGGDEVLERAIEIVSSL